MNASEKFRGEINCRNREEMLRFQNVALNSGYAVAIRPMGSDEYKITIYIDNEPARR